MIPRRTENSSVTYQNNYFIHENLLPKKKILFTKTKISIIYKIKNDYIHPQFDKAK